MNNYLTTEGLEKLKSELETVKTKLKETSLKIKEAREMGDLSENAEYHEAKNEQSFLAGREQELQDKIKNAKIISGTCDTNAVSIGCKVDVEEDGEKLSYTIVGSDEADPFNGKISSDSPIGSALIGHQKGETVKAKTPGGEIVVKILKIG